MGNMLPGLKFIDVLSMSLKQQAVNIGNCGNCEVRENEIPSEI